MKENSFIKLYEQTFRNHFEYPALTDYGTHRTLTYGDVAKQVEKLHILLEECKVKKGDKVALVGRNNSNWCIAFMGVVTYGAVVVPILHDFSADDIHHIVNHSDSVLLFASDSIWETLEGDKITELRMAFSLTDFNLLYKKSREESVPTQEEINEKLEKKYPAGFSQRDINYDNIPDSNIIVLNYTSGTTGFSKGVMITGDNLTGNLTFAHNTIHLEKGDNMISFLPLAHTYGCAFEFLFPFMEGCHITLLNKTPSPKILLKAYEEIKPVLIIVVPLILEKIYKKMIYPMISKSIMRVALNIPIVNEQIYTRIRKKLTEAFGGKFSQIITGGAPLNREVEDFLIKIKFPITVGYGMTECAPLISFSQAKDYVPHSCGKVLPNMQIRIDSEDPYNIAGEIQVKGQNVMAGYYKNEEATKETFTKDGWLKTGDLGTIDKDQNVFIRGRSKSMILGASGQNIYPEGIEAKLDNFPFITESIVVERNGKLVALVYPDYDAIDAEKISVENLPNILAENKDELNKILAGYEKISEIQIHPHEFEKTPKKSIKRYLYK